MSRIELDSTSPVIPPIVNSSMKLETIISSIGNSLEVCREDVHVKILIAVGIATIIVEEVNRYVYPLIFL